MYIMHQARGMYGSLKDGSLIEERFTIAIIAGITSELEENLPLYKTTCLFSVIFYK